MAENESNRMRFVNKTTGEDAFIYSAEMNGYYCVVCGSTSRSLYSLPEIIDHKFNNHTDYYYENGQTKSRTIAGSELLDGVLGV